MLRYLENKHGPATPDLNYYKKRRKNELKNAEVIVKDEVDDLKYEILQSIAEVLKTDNNVRERNC